MGRRGGLRGWHLLLMLPLLGTVAAEEPPLFFDVLDGQPLNLSPLPGEELSEAVLEFHHTGRNPYHNDAEAREEGRKLYLAHCAFCHGRAGEGALGPPLDGTDWTYAISATDAGMFSIIHGGAYGGMDSFARRGMHQDEMLRIIAFVRTLQDCVGCLAARGDGR
ncbi:c-type cytochrome [Crenalkalicoccus roseus]|uniref:c-type cytochrome n=1 Tax=Crenalkalicoccus roseus TaxID=1485588 RepID=UPI0010815D6E|nr:c-type cytochrome [Crenalkalicoccus roseus]